MKTNQSKLIEQVVRESNAKNRGGAQVDIAQARNLIKRFLAKLGTIEAWRVLKMIGK
jgi:hypothetical protein